MTRKVGLDSNLQSLCSSSPGLYPPRISVVFRSQLTSLEWEGLYLLVTFKVRGKGTVSE